MSKAPGFETCKQSYYIELHDTEASKIFCVQKNYMFDALNTENSFQGVLFGCL